jgi:hypothetical protein
MSEKPQDSNKPASKEEKPVDSTSTEAAEDEETQ